MKKTVFLLIIISLTLSGCTKFFDTKTFEQDSTGNRISGGFVAVHNDYIYFANLNYENKLFRMDMNGDNQVQLSDHPNVSHMLQMQFSENNIYYLQSDIAENGTNKYSLYMFDLDNHLETKLSDENIYTFVIYEEKIYFSNLVLTQNNLSRSDLFRMDLNGENIELINSSDYLSFFQISNSRLFVELEEGIAIMNLNGSEATSKYLGLHFPVIVHEDNIYFISYGLSKTNLDIKSFDKQIIVEDEILAFTIYEEMIYYATTSNKIYKTDLNGQNTEFVTDGNSPIVYDGYIFYYSLDNELKFIKR